MSNDPNILEKYVRRDREPDPESGTEDLGIFGWLRGAKERALYVELRKRDGNAEAFGYAWVQRIGLNPSEGITLWFPGQKIRIIGQNLNAEVRPMVRLFDGLMMQRITWIQETPEAEQMTADERRPVIERLEW